MVYPILSVRYSCSRKPIIIHRQLCADYMAFALKCAKWLIVCRRSLTHAARRTPFRLLAARRASRHASSRSSLVARRSLRGPNSRTVVSSCALHTTFDYTTSHLVVAAGPRCAGSYSVQPFPTAQYVFRLLVSGTCYNYFVAAEFCCFAWRLHLYGSCIYM